MACLSQEQRLAAAKMVNITVDKSRAKRKSVKLPKNDYHCEVCGHTGPHKEHSCPGPKPIGYVLDREYHCSRCHYADEGICTLEKSVHPDRDCIIATGIAMPEAYCKAGKWDRVLFKCPECNTLTFNEMGANRCKQCGYGAPLKIRLPHRIVIDHEDPLPANSDLAVITIAGGQKAIEILELTEPGMRAYADACGADFHAIRTNLHPEYPIANKFRLKNLVGNYKRILFLDVDIWIRDRTPDLFASCPSGMVWMHMDYPYLEKTGWVQDEAGQTAKEQAVDIIRLKVLNTGVVLFDREHANIWNPPPLPAKLRHLTEQTWVEFNLKRFGFSLGLLNIEYNTQYWMPQFKELEPKANFVHLANCPHDERIYRLRKYQWEKRSGIKATDL